MIIRKHLAGIALFCFLLLLTSCASTMSMYIEVEKPAVVTLPVTAQNVIIVNNALPQPMGSGMAAPSGKNPGNDSAYIEALNMASWNVMAKTFKYLDDSGFFPNVSLYKQFLREDNEWLAIVPLQEAIKKDFFENEDFDLLISIDRLLLKTENQPNKLELGRLYALLTFSAYLRDKDRPVVQQTLTDSVTVNYSDIYFDGGVPYINYEELATVMIRHSTGRLGERLGKYFAPSWDTAERIYFVKNFTDAKRVIDYVNKEKWREAKAAWTTQYESGKKAADKAKSATNIALACEMRGEFSEAGVWAKEAKAYFQTDSPKKYSKEINYLDGYIKVLQEREKHNAKLNKQYGIEER
jgi:hypothetical protein